MLSYVREGGLVRMWSIYRHARNLSDLENIVNELVAGGVSIEFVKERLVFSPRVEEAF